MKTDIGSNIFKMLKRKKNIAEELVSGFQDEREMLREDVKQQNYYKLMMDAGKKLASKFFGPYKVIKVERGIDMMWR